MIVVIQDPETLGALGGHFHRRCVCEIDVWPAIAIVIDQYNASTHRLDDISLRRVGSMGEGDAAGGSDIFKLRHGTARAFDALRSGRRRRRRRMSALSRSESDRQGKNRDRAKDM